ncbi:hypothetical protein [Actinophytocola xanthii]|uniref:SH3b domain-containing protein n=1 Tax=Actinophytocola xanthii TaxID=1912961 RepID=A0A1Q8C7P6_9PSEU|nr:hypothetical protein [Actinophytocola xanthii]OLF10387.1 hypothetical protein BU204_31805 [Actinophytocola xanthii]
MTAAVLAGLALATTATVASAGTASASASAAATLCNVNQNTWVRILPGFSGVIGTIPAGGGFRIDGATPAYADGLWWWYGHGSDWVRSGWVPDQNLTNCH